MRSPELAPNSSMVACSCRLEPRFVDLDAEGGEQLAQLAVGRIQSAVDLLHAVIQLRLTAFLLHQPLQTRQLQLLRGQRLGQRIVQLAGDHRTFFHQRQSGLLLPQLRQAQGSGEQIGQCRQQQGLPGLQRLAGRMGDAQRAEIVLSGAQLEGDQFLSAGQSPALVDRAHLALRQLAVIRRLQVAGGHRRVAAGLRGAVQAQRDRPGIEDFLHLGQQRTHHQRGVVRLAVEHPGTVEQQLQGGVAAITDCP